MYWSMKVSEAQNNLLLPTFFYTDNGGSRFFGNADTHLSACKFFHTWIPRLRLATWRCEVTCSIASSSIVRRWRTLPSTLAARNVSLCCGNPASSSHRNTHAVSSSPDGIRWGSSVATFSCCDSSAKCSFFRWIGFCKKHSQSLNVPFHNYLPMWIFL